jgi:methylmalonyl-CoA mutase N-terminal domain/subunit
MDPSVESEQVARVRGLRAARSRTACDAALGQVTEAARGGENLVPSVVHAVEQRATIGEIADAMRQVFGEYQDTSAG